MFPLLNCAGTCREAILWVPLQPVLQSHEFTKLPWTCPAGVCQGLKSFRGAESLFEGVWGLDGSLEFPSRHV